MPSKQNIHLIKALSTAINLGKRGRVVQNDVLEALNINLLPPASPTATSPKTTDRIRYHMSREYGPTRRRIYFEVGRDHMKSPIAVGLWNCRLLLQEYRRIHDLRQTGGYYLHERHILEAPAIKQRRREYRLEFQTGFTIQWGRALPYRTCAIVQPRHSGEMRLSGSEILALLMLALESHENAPNEEVHTVHVFAVDPVSVRRLSAKIPSAYIRTIRRAARMRPGPEVTLDEIVVEQSPYYDLYDDQHLESVLAALLEHEVMRAK